MYWARRVRDRLLLPAALLAALLGLTVLALRGQQQRLPDAAGADQAPFTIEHADRFYQRQSPGQEGRLLVLEGQVRVQHGPSRIACDWLGYFTAEQYLLCAGEVVVVDTQLTLRADTVYYFEQEAYYRALGSLDWAAEGLTGTGREGRWFSRDRRLEIEGAPAVVHDSLRTLEALRLFYQTETGELRALEQVRLVDSQSGTEALAASGLYRRDQRMATLLGRPRVDYFEAGDSLRERPYHLVADIVRSYAGDSLSASGRVRLWDDSLSVSSDSLFHDRGLGLSYFRGGRPRVDNPEYTLSGELIDVATRERELERVTAVGQARGEFAAGAEGADSLEAEASGQPALFRNWIEGDTLELLFGGAGLDSIISVGGVSGHARSYFRESAESGLSYVLGKRILLAWEAGELARIEVERGGRGLFISPDTLAEMTVVPDSAKINPADTLP